MTVMSDQCPTSVPLPPHIPPSSSHARLTCGGASSLCLAGVLVDDIRGDGLLLLLLPHQEDALMDEHVLLLHMMKSLI